MEKRRVFSPSSHLFGRTILRLASLRRRRRRAPRRRATGGGRLSRSGAEGGSALGEIGVQHENKTVQNSATLWKIVEMSTCNLILKIEEML